MKKIISALMVSAFVLAAGAAFAAQEACTIESVEGSKVVLKCDKADAMKAGEKVTVKAAKKMEGC